MSLPTNVLDLRQSNNPALRRFLALHIITLDLNNTEFTDTDLKTICETLHNITPTDLKLAIYETAKKIPQP